MKGMTLERMAQACNARLCGAPMDQKRQETPAAGIVTDSRQVKENFVFVALPGERVDGHDFIPQVFEAGALAVVCEREPEQATGVCLLVESSKEALKKLAALYLDELAIPVVGITGSVGKTSTKEMIASVLSQKYCVHKTAGNFNNEIGLPLTVFGLREEHEVAVLEMGISDFGEMSRLAAVARPKVSVITNIGICHLENLGTRDGILKAKTEVFDYLRDDATVVLNGDDDKLCTVAAVQGKAPVFYGMGEALPVGAAYEKKSIFADAVENKGLRGIDFDLHLPEKTHRVHVTIPGEHNVYNAMAAAAVGLALGLSEQEICTGIEAARTIGGRTNLIEAHDYLVIDDCYNANPVSMKAALDVLTQGEGRTIAVLGDMGELGTDEKKLHYEVGAYVAEKHIAWLFAAGELSRELVRGVEEYPDFTTQYDYFGTDVDALCRRVCEFAQPGDTILVKASHFMDYPRIVKALTE
ncbi:MAG: UDP-N-acetylmuramoyl-tripeptide--D-alanyl-D-alanine ligase [Lachnospiraceae bacterium]